MVICKFFLQGACRYGENCRFEHDLSGGHHGPTSILKHQQFGSNTNVMSTKPNAIPDDNTLVRSVTNDIITAEKGRQWLLSSYSPFKEKGTFPGFEDRSCEEIRFLYYEATKNGTVPQYAQQLQALLGGVVTKMRALQNPTPDIVNLIRSIYTGGAQSTSASGMQTPFGQAAFGTSAVSNPTTVFRMANQQLFTNNTDPAFVAKPSGSVYCDPALGLSQPSNSTSIFGGAQPSTQGFSQGVFGGNNQQPSGKSPLLSGLQASSNFGKQQSPFGQNSTSFGQQPLFGQSQSGFGQQLNAFGQQPLQSPTFGNQQSNQAPVFGQQQNHPASSVFAATQFSSKSPVLTQQPSQSLAFGQLYQLPVPIQSLTTTTASKQSGGTSSIFGLQTMSAAFPDSNYPSTLQQNVTTPFGSTVSKHSHNDADYSKLENLTEDEIKIFNSDTFEFGKIPEKPPTFEMCF